MTLVRRSDLAKLAFHRLVARRLKYEPGILEEARDIVRGWKQEQERPTYVDQWDELLWRSVDEVRREIVRRTPDATRLRLSSPFYLTIKLSEDQRRRTRKIGRHLASAA